MMIRIFPGRCPGLYGFRPLGASILNRMFVVPCSFAGSQARLGNPLSRKLQLLIPSPDIYRSRLRKLELPRQRSQAELGSERPDGRQNGNLSHPAHLSQSTPLIIPARPAWRPDKADYKTAITGLLGGPSPALFMATTTYSSCTPRGCPVRVISVFMEVFTTSSLRPGFPHSDGGSRRRTLYRR
uniref:Uncharacterized protein n=1 Tax=Candidatus Kentrum sp. DK TaxID=2126562 RepID=A0A450TGQ5_9GAMM|nr:MAG: hypothetical protein BECKDK2373B_GA0170837_11675 [Candidatus Kentron sp. DK]